MATESERLLDLMFGAKDRYRTAHATIREWRDERVADEVRERFSETELYREVFGLPEPGTARPGERGDFERIWKVWRSPIAGARRPSYPTAQAPSTGS
ncbi:MAG TPA: hypothetical protein VJ827_10625 [Rubrobacter sp.]|nr:hypothetical protein [Rubrobacter sp.]